ncbi:MAG: SAM-dependent methyltransferase [Planctomycetota bacterium]
MFHDGDLMLDLGCAPGSWIQIACERIEDEGRVVGIDLMPVAIFMPVTRIGDRLLVVCVGDCVPPPLQRFTPCPRLPRLPCLVQLHQ